MSPHPTPTTGDETPRPLDLDANPVPALNPPPAITVELATEAAG